MLLLKLAYYRSAVDKEFEKNKKLGERLGCWKGSYLVEDDAGSVRKALQGQKYLPEQGVEPAAVAESKQASSKRI